MSLYGYGRDTTPNLARLARRGVTFTQARSTAPWTLPSHASMMTGRWPHQQSARLHGPLDGRHTTLAQFLAAHGYATAGFVANTTYCSAETGLARGFAHYEDHDLSPQGILCTSALGRRLIWPGLVGASQWLGYDLRVDTPQGRGADQRRPARLAQDHGPAALLRLPELPRCAQPLRPPRGLRPTLRRDARVERRPVHSGSMVHPRQGEAQPAGHPACQRRLRRLPCLPRRAARPALRRARPERRARQYAGHRHRGPRRTVRRTRPLLPCEQPLRPGDPRPAPGHSPRSRARGAHRRRAGQPARPAGDHRRDSRPRRHRALPRPIARPILGSLRAVPSPSHSSRRSTVPPRPRRIWAVRRPSRAR